MPVCSEELFSDARFPIFKPVHRFLIAYIHAGTCKSTSSGSKSIGKGTKEKGLDCHPPIGWDGRRLSGSEQKAIVVLGFIIV
jgi:hypothetical protein